MYLFQLVNVLIEMAIVLFYCRSTFEPKDNVSNISKILLFVVLTAVSTITGSLQLPTAVNMAISFCICVIYAHCLYNGEMKNKIFMSVIYEVAIIFADILAANIITFFGIEYSMIGGDNITYIAGAMLSNFIRLWVLAYIGKALSRRVHNLPVSYWIFLFVCPLLSVVCLVIFDIYLMQAETINRLLVFIPPFCILYINFMFFRFFETFSDKIRLKVMEETARSEEENYKILQNNESELRELRHDMKNHIMMLHEYLGNNDTETALQHLKNIQGTLERISATVCTNNPAIDAAINIGARKAQAQNIEYTAQIVGDKKVNVEAADICKFLSNAIDNAIEACADCEKKYVYIELNITENSVKIHIENTTKLKSNLLPLFTTKTDRKNHGFGMKNMKSVVKKYNGIMEHKISNEVFCLDAILYCNK